MSLRIKKTLAIGGMTCTHCEKAVTRALTSLDSVTVLSASFERGQAELIYDSETVTEADISRVVEEAGYEVKGAAAARKPLSPLQMAGAAALAAALWLLIDRTIGFSFIPELQTEMSYGMLFVVGLLTSLHCIAMCGGINLSQCIVTDAGSGDAGWKRSLAYNGGRVISYTVIGGLMTEPRAPTSFSGSARGLVAIVAGAFMMLMGINMLGLIPGLRRYQLRIPAGLRQGLLGPEGRRGPLVVGLLNGLMPCGPLQAMQLYALGTGSAVTGALSMFFFSLGTVPLMFGFGALSTLLSRRFTRNMVRAGAVLVILLGAVMLQRGLSLGGASALQLTAGGNGGAPAGITAVVSDGVQKVQGELGRSSYPAITVRKGIPVQFNLHADAASLNGCNDALLIPAFGIEQGLSAGDNIIEFTPTETGTYTYTCWMGMITRQITVVE